MPAYAYPIALAICSLVVALLERLWPWRPEQKVLRPRLWSDYLHLVFNGHYLGVILYGVATWHVLPHLDAWLVGGGLYDVVYRDAASSWPLWLQIVVVLVVIDFVQWCVHNLLHRVPLFWEFHKAHHSIVDGEMDWIVSFRFQWTEVVVYRTAQYLPLAFFGFAPEAVLFHAIFGTLIGHFNHANLDWSWGPLKYVLNSPAMHIWHHDYDGDEKTTVNFGIIFSTWDWIFGTAKMPGHPPKKLGFAGVETFPTDFFAQMAWPLSRLFRSDRAGQLGASAFGVLVVAAGFWLAEPPRPASASPADHVEAGASSQPAKALKLASAKQATAALARFGDDAREAGYARPEFMVSVDEVKAALGSPRLVLVDVRPLERFRAGHIPTARQADRATYSSSDDVPGLSRSREELQEALRALGVREDSVVVLYGDGGPEPYRMWWTLREVGGYDTRVLDGGLAAWKAEELPAPEGDPDRVAAGDVVLPGTQTNPTQRWAELADVLAREGLHVVDNRSEAEFLGEEQHDDAARAGRIPGGDHLAWERVLRGEGDSRLLSPVDLTALLDDVGLDDGGPVLAYCQSGTRTSAFVFALLQAGFADEDVVNYDGSWAEYSRTDLPLETGAPSGDADEPQVCASGPCPTCVDGTC